MVDYSTIEIDLSVKESAMDSFYQTLKSNQRANTELWNAFLFGLKVE